MLILCLVLIPIFYLNMVDRFFWEIYEIPRKYNIHFLDWEIGFCIRNSLFKLLKKYNICLKFIFINIIYKFI